jgi:hypothetical protein
MDEESSRIFALRPVTFHYNEGDASEDSPRQVGLVAEEVAATVPELAIYDESGRPESVAYHLLPTMLLNELKKEHAALVEAQARIDELTATSSLVAQLTREIADLKAQMADRAALADGLAEVRALRAELERNGVVDRRDASSRDAARSSGRQPASTAGGR